MIVLLLLLIYASAQSQHYTPGKASWLGSRGASSTPDYKHHFPIIYVILGINGTPHIRAIVEYNDLCPSPMRKEDVEYNLQEVHLDVRVLGNPINENKMPYKFPVKVCELKVEDGTVHRKLLEKGLLHMNWKNQSYQIAHVKSNPERFMFISDTGLRIKPSNLGLGNVATGEYPCNASTVYGIHQCFLNFTDEDLKQPQTGNFQGLDEWYFKQLVDDATAKAVDVVVHLGDYLYRQGPCPLNNTDILDGVTKDCGAVNLPEHATADEIANHTIMNFIPGEYGDNWWGWWSDFFWPFLSLLNTAPVIALRGNHEICDRGGYGYFMFLSPVEMKDYCVDNFPPYSVKFDHEQFLVMDDSIIEELNKGVDHFLPGQCPGSPKSGYIVPIEQNRYNDTNDQTIDDHLNVFTQHFHKIEQMSLQSDTNFYLGHRPIFGIGCNNGTIAALDWTLQQSLGRTTLDRISATFSGHMHWLQVMEFENNSLPPNILVGNGGTKMIRNNIEQTSIPHIEFQIHQHEFTLTGKVKNGMTLSQFGYSIMERSHSGLYTVNFNMWDKDKRIIKALDYHLEIQSGKSDKMNLSDGKTQKINSNIPLLMILLVGCWFFIWKWSRAQRKRGGYSQIYEMEPLQKS